MARTRCFLGVDVSTTGSKAVLIDERGELIADASTPHTLHTPQPLWSEEDPGEWWEASTASIREVIRKCDLGRECVGAIGLTGQMHGLVLLDGIGKVLRPAILWNDQRTSSQCEEIHRRFGKANFIAVTGNAALAGFTAPKLLWVKENEPEVYARTRHVLLPKDYVRHRLTGDYAMDKSDASGTVLFDLTKRDWSEEILTALAIDRAWLPPTHEGTEVTGVVSEEAAEAAGLMEGIPVVAGGGDQACQAVGVGAVRAGVTAITLGTSGVVFASTPRPRIERGGRLHAFCHAVPGMWHLMGVMLCAAGSLQWYRDRLAPGLSFDDLLSEVRAVPPGSEGLIFLPYLSGERTPHADPLARAGFIGLTLRHGRGHMTRALLEGVAFGLKDCLALVESAGQCASQQVRISGGGARSDAWKGILASVLGTELVTTNVSEGAAFGAALLAAVGARVWPDVETAVDEAVRTVESTPPDLAATGRYEQSYEIYKGLYPALSQSYSRMAGI